MSNKNFGYRFKGLTGMRKDKVIEEQFDTIQEVCEALLAFLNEEGGLNYNINPKFFHGGTPEHVFFEHWLTYFYGWELCSNGYCEIVLYQHIKEGELMSIPFGTNLDSCTLNYFKMLHCKHNLEWVQKNYPMLAL